MNPSQAPADDALIWEGPVDLDESRERYTPDDQSLPQALGERKTASDNGFEPTKAPMSVSSNAPTVDHSQISSILHVPEETVMDLLSDFPTSAPRNPHISVPTVDHSQAPSILYVPELLDQVATFSPTEIIPSERDASARPSLETSNVPSSATSIFQSSSESPSRSNEPNREARGELSNASLSHFHLEPPLFQNQCMPVPSVRNVQ